MLTGKIAPVKIGFVTIEGLLLSDNTFAVALVQAWNIIDEKVARQRNTMRQTKALLGEGFPLVKVKTNINSNPVSVITLNTFELLITKADRADYKGAQEFRDTLIGLSLHQLFCDAFEIEFDREDRQAWFKERQVGKAVRRTLTDAIRDYSDENQCSDTYKQWIYSNVSVEVCKAVFGCKPSSLAKWREIDPKKVRDSLNVEELRLFQDIERLTMRLIDEDKLEPMIAVKEAARALRIKRIEV